MTVDPNAKTTTFDFDAAGNQTAVFTPDGKSMVTSFDADNRQTQQVWYDALGNTVDTIKNSFDNDGKMLTASNTNGTYNFSYDAAGRLTNVAEPYSATLTYAYDGVGNQTQVADSFGGTQVSVYDLDNRLTCRTYTGQSQNMRVDFTYGPNGQVATEKRYSDLSATTLVATTTDLYDGNGNVTSIQTNDASSTQIDKFAYAYDAAGNVSSEVDTQNATATTTNYSYDADNQLTAAGGASYTYDANGNRSTGTTIGTGNQLTSDGTFNYTYDAKGEEITKTNISTGDKWTYTYNNGNELIEAKETDSLGTTETDEQ